MTELAKRYGDSLYELAAEEGLAAELLPPLEGAVACLKENPAYLRLLATPSIPQKERTALLGEAFDGQLHPYLLNFFKLLCDEGLLNEAAACARQYHTRYNADAGIVSATALTAVPLTEADRTRLAQKLAEMTGKTVELNVKVDPAVLGGIRI
ncbi:MAG: ATP synthase F1 subunit delta, partial [Gemmiger sp.]|nr:ATP synthase F1 subunit delta [Gemmiger sp.]